MTMINPFLMKSNIENQKDQNLWNSYLKSAIIPKLNRTGWSLKGGLCGLWRMVIWCQVDLSIYTNHLVCGVSNK